MLNHVFRYEPVAKVIADAGVSSLLEAGSGSQGITPHLLAPCAVTASDVSWEDYGAGDAGAPDGVVRVRSSVTDLPFASESFDAAVGLDLLEHLAPEERAPAIAELARVARRLVVVGCPCGPPARESDRRLEAWFHATSRPVPPWLIEHLDLPFPDPTGLVREADRYGAVRVLRNESLGAHWAVTVLEGMPVTWRLSVWSGDLLRRSLRMPSRHRAARAGVRALRGFDRGDCYRTIVVIDKAAA